jgi:hypothetical protein
LLTLPFTKATKVPSAFLCSFFAATNNLHHRFPRVGDPQGQEDTHHKQWRNLPAFAEQDAAPGDAEDKRKRSSHEHDVQRVCCQSCGADLISLPICTLPSILIPRSFEMQRWSGASSDRSRALLVE